jgi:hypothetical protein
MSETTSEASDTPAFTETTMGVKYEHLLTEEAPAEEKAETQEAEGKAEEVPAKEGTETQEEIKDETKDEKADDKTEDEEVPAFKPKTFKVKGKDFIVDSQEKYDELAQKGLAFTQKSQKLSAEAKQGVRLNAALQDGDMAAAKGIIEELKTKLGKEDLYDLITSIEEADGDFDLDNAVRDKENLNALDKAFEGVDRSTEQFQATIDTINTDVKDFIPEALYSQIISNPDELRLLHDLVDSGAYADTKDLMLAKINTLSESEYKAATSDPDKYAAIYAEILNQRTKELGLANEETSNSSQDESADKPKPDEDSTNPPPTFSSGERNATVERSGPIDWDKDEEAYTALLNKLKGKPVV